MSMTEPGFDTSVTSDRREAIRMAIHGNAALSAPYLIMNGLSAVVATYGLLQNSAAVVIGAMIIALLLGPITGMALALVEGDNRNLFRCILAEIAGVALVLGVGFIIGFVHRDLPIGSEILGRTAPTVLDLAIAIAAGAAGAYAALTPRISSSLVGVAIATAVVPPLCACAICLSRGLFKAGGGAFLLFITNIVAIQCATSIVLALNGYASNSMLKGKKFVQQFGPSVVLLGSLAIFLAYSLQRAVARESLRSAAERYLRGEIEHNGAAHLADMRMSPNIEGSGTRITAVVRAPWIIVPQSCGRLETGLRRAIGREDIKLHVRTILTRECNSRQFLWEETSSAAAAPAGATP